MVQGESKIMEERRGLSIQKIGRASPRMPPWHGLIRQARNPIRLAYENRLTIGDPRPGGWEPVVDGRRFLS